MSELIYKQDAIDLVKEVCDAIMSGCDSHYDPETEDEVYNDILEVDAILKCNKEIRIALANLPSAEPEIIHCKNCKHRESNDCPMYYEEWIEIDEGDGYFDTDNIIHDWTTDEGFCHCAELRGKEE